MISVRSVSALDGRGGKRVKEHSIKKVRFRRLEMKEGL